MPGFSGQHVSWNGSTYLGCDGLRGVEAASRAAGSGAVRLWIVGRLLRLMIRTSWSLVECDGEVSGLFSKEIAMCCEVLPCELAVEDGGPAVVECGEALIAGVWLALGGSIQWGLRIEAG